MSDGELSDFGDDDIVRQHENRDSDGNDENNSNQENIEDVILSDEEVKVGDDENTAQKVDPPKKKKTTRKLFVLNSERLKGPKGIHTIEKLYEGFKFKGKGHEKEDLDRVMKRLEYWAFRLFPKLDYDDFLAKCEHLGHKKDLLTHLKKYRLGMITADDIMPAENIVEEDDETDDPAFMRQESELRAQIADDNFQRLFDQTAQGSEQAS